MTAETIETETTELTVSAEAVRGYGTQLGAMFLERTAEIRSLLVATIAREHVLLLGPPGTAKSALMLAFSAGLGWRSFERLLGRTTVLEELFGPYSLLGLEQDRFERVCAGYLPTAEVAFLDEIFKGSSAILNSLLTALNERSFDNGAGRHHIPLRIAVGASNELPQEEGLTALYDRFMLRHWVDYLRDEDSFSALLLMADAEQPTLDPRHFDILSAALRTVQVDHLVPAIVAIRQALAEVSIVPSDRRWRKAMGLIKASAVLDGRTIATRRDLAVLCDCLWDRPTDRDVIRAIVAKLRNPQLAKAEELLAALHANMAKVPSAGTVSPNQLGALQAVLVEVNKMMEEAMKLDQSGNDPEVHAVFLQIAREAKAFRATCLAKTSGLRV